MTLLRTLIDWKQVAERLMEVSNDDRQIDAYIDDKMREIIRAKHPNDYDKFMSDNREKLAKLKADLKSEYIKDLRERVPRFFASTAAKS